MTFPLRGAPLLRDPRFNKGTAFTEEERESLGLMGLLPDGVDTLETQVRRAFTQLAEKNSNLGKYIYLSSLQDTNETLFYRVLRQAPAELLPLVYTPTVGEACERYGLIMRRTKGLYVGINHKGRVREILRNWPVSDVRFIVVTNGNRILGLGDLGANGMAIPIGKLALYTACGGVPPEFTLPVLIDLGTDNSKLLNDPLYLGLRRPRPSAEELDEFVEEFVEAVQEVFPRCCIQFEDWAGVDAMRLLERYRDRVCCFNDDIQGTAAVALAGLMGATRITGKSLSQQRVLFLGAGSAGLGIAGLLTQAMVLEGLGLKEAQSQIALFDIHGLIESTRTDLHQFQKPYAHELPPIKDFAEAIEYFKPTAIVGVSTVARAFDRRVIEAMAKVNDRPIIFPYSNPTSRSECTAEEAYQWSQGRAVFASGSPFPPVRYADKTFVPGQGNNVYIFPAIGMAVYATQATRVTDEMFIAAARGVAEQVMQSDLDVGLIYPPQSELLRTELLAATRVAEVIYARGLTKMPRPDDLEALIRAHAYIPEYHSLG